MQLPPLQVPMQQSALVVQVPPIGWQVRPVCTQLPFWHWPPLQQSESVVHGGWLTQRPLAEQTRPAPQLMSVQLWPDSGRHAAWQP